MTEYLLSAAGVIFLSVIISLVIPEGKLNKSITFIMRLISILVLIQPVSGIFKIGGDNSSDGGLADYTYVSMVYSEHQSEQLELLLQKECGVETECSVKVEFKEGDFKVTAVEVGIVGGESDGAALKEKVENRLSELGYENVFVFIINF
ncbi:MAG: stage III sporulation protein AF [Clostridia bacterium]|nr:stage III sporulation protein AF [Clostridia bacterium]